ncbi:MAG: hypothetical protein HOW73_31540 [Polyangiaceae bacterium]|nr:hypothetical protein [Polyangiaceae bacterium]
MEQPWSEEQARWVVRRAATLSLCGAEPVGPLVLPDTRFFPDKFDRSPESVARLFERMKEHVGLDETTTEVVLVDPEEGRVVTSCSSGGCGTGAVKTLGGDRVEKRDDGYVVAVATSEIGHSTVLTTVLARAIGQIFLREVDALKRFPKNERQAAGDLAASMLGLAVLVANGSGIEVKGCGGIKVHSATSFGVQEATLALALVELRRELRSGASKDPGAGLARGLDNVPRGIYPLARALFDENRDIVRRIDNAPESVERGDFSLRAPGSSLTTKLRRLFGGSKPRDEDPLDALEREASLAAASGAASSRRAVGPRSDRLDEIRALVDESFDTR